MADQRIEKWARWLSGTVKNDVFTMHLQRMAWREVSAMLAANDSLPDSYWWEFMRDTYSTTQAIAVRRQADTMKGVASLGKIIEEISGEARRFTRQWWISHQEVEDDEYWTGVAEESWSEHFGGAETLDPKVVAADRAMLAAIASRVRRYVDSHVAHADAAPPEVTLTLSDIHDAIDTLGELFKKYGFLVNGASWAFVEPRIQHDWMAAFRVPWLRRRARWVPTG